MSSFNYGRVDQSVFIELRKARERRMRMYIIAEKDYPIADMLHFDGEHIEDWIETDIRRLANESGFTVAAHSRDEKSLPWREQTRVYMSVETVDNVVVYCIKLKSHNALVAADGREAPSEY